MGSSMSRRRNRRILTRFSSSDLGSSLRASHLLLTKLAMRYHTMCAKSLVVKRKSGVRSVVDCALCRFRHHGGNRPGIDVSLGIVPIYTILPYPHSCVKRSSNLIILLKSWTASKNLRKPKLPDGPLHMPNFTLSWRWCFHPLRWFSANTTHHIGMGECLRRPRLRFDIECGRDWLCYPRMKRRGSTWNNQILVVVVASTWPAITISSPWSKERMAC
jgi:hypothetical protein